jgi:hypothetical protein
MGLGQLRGPVSVDALTSGYPNQIADCRACAGWVSVMMLTGWM